MGVLLPQTFMNDSGRSAGPARGALGVPLERVVVVHDEIDLPFGRVEARLGGGLAGHNGLKSLKAELGGPDFHRVRVGVGRPDTTDPEIVSAHVLGRFSEPEAEVRDLVERRSGPWRTWSSPRPRGLVARGVRGREPPDPHQTMSRRCSSTIAIALRTATQRSITSVAAPADRDQSYSSPRTAFAAPLTVYAAMSSDTPASTGSSTNR